MSLDSQSGCSWKKQGEMTIFEACEPENKEDTYQGVRGRISGEFVYIYPPGIPCDCSWRTYN